MRFLLTVIIILFSKPTSAKPDLERQMAMAVTEHDEQRIAKLIEANANPNGRMPIQHSNAISPSFLHETVNRGLLASTRLLLKKGADIHARSYDNWQVMHIVAKSRHQNRVDMARELLANGAKAQLNTPDIHHFTPVHWAAIAKNYDLIELFAKAGGDLDLAVKKPGAEFSPLTMAAYHGSADGVDLLIRLGVKVKGEQGYKALESAAKVGHIDVIEKLIAAGAPMHKPGNHGPETALVHISLLHRAVKEGQPKVVEALVAAGANVNLPFESYGGNEDAPWGGSTLLMTAVGYRDEKVALGMTEAILKGKPNLNTIVQNPKFLGNGIMIPPPQKKTIDRTALTIAREMKRPQLVQLLTDAGATR